MWFNSQVDRWQVLCRLTHASLKFILHWMGNQCSSDKDYLLVNEWLVSTILATVYYKSTTEVYCAMPTGKRHSHAQYLPLHQVRRHYSWQTHSPPTTWWYQELWLASSLGRHLCQQTEQQSTTVQLTTVTLQQLTILNSHMISSSKNMVKLHKILHNLNSIVHNWH